MSDIPTILHNSRTYQVNGESFDDGLEAERKEYGAGTKAVFAHILQDMSPTTRNILCGLGMTAGIALIVLGIFLWSLPGVGGFAAFSVMGIGFSLMISSIKIAYDYSAFKKERTNKKTLKQIQEETKKDEDMRQTQISTCLECAEELSLEIQTTHQVITNTINKRQRELARLHNEPSSSHTSAHQKVSQIQQEIDSLEKTKEGLISLNLATSNIITLLSEPNLSTEPDKLRQLVTYLHRYSSCYNALLNMQKNLGCAIKNLRSEAHKSCIVMLAKKLEEKQSEACRLSQSSIELLN